MDDVEQITDPISRHGEGPVWWPAWGGLRWVDMLAGDVLHLDELSGRVRRKHLSNIVAAIRPRADGGAVLGVERGFMLLEAGDDGFGGGTKPPTSSELWIDPEVRMNEGGCDPDGRFYCGTHSYRRTPEGGRLYRLETNGDVSEELTEVTTSNGLVWSPNGSLAYYVDSALQRIDAFDYDPTLGLTNRRVVVDVPIDAGEPDGLTVDADGYLWLAMFGGSSVLRYSADGKLEGKLALAATQVTACTFGGPRLDTLYITTSQLGIDPRNQPLAGAVFSARVGVRGVPTLAYGG
jgi:sugar lactone lactonase YvrE